MSADTVTKVTRESWFSRIGGAFKGIAFGVLLVLAAVVLLFSNEGRAVKRDRALGEGAGIVVSVESDRIDAANEGKLVHTSGQATSDVTLTDPVFGVSARALKLARSVEMYQWQECAQSETKDKVGGGQETVTTYTYAKDWSSMAVDSAGFQEPAGHENPGAIPYEAEEQVAEPVTLGAFTLSPSLVGRLDDFEPLNLPSGTAVPASLRGRARIQGASFYIGQNPSAPQVGDVRVSFSVVLPAEVSVVSKQVGDGLEPYETKNGQTIELLESGAVSAAAMFETAEKSNTVLTWVLRVAGLLVMALGFGMTLRPLSVIADVIPFVGNIVSAGTGFISFLAAAAVSLTTISIAWIFYRPLIGLAIFAVVIGLTVAIVLKLRSAKKAEPAPAAAEG